MYIYKYICVCVSVCLCLYIWSGLSRLRSSKNRAGESREDRYDSWRNINSRHVISLKLRKKKNINDKIYRNFKRNVLCSISDFLFLQLTHNKRRSKWPFTEIDIDFLFAQQENIMINSFFSLTNCSRHPSWESKLKSRLSHPRSPSRKSFLSSTNFNIFKEKKKCFLGNSLF